MSRVIGIGSPFGDDRAAWEVVRELETLDLPGVDLVTLNQPGASLVARFDDVRELYLVDTLVSADVTDMFVRLRPDDLDRTGTGLSTHGQQLTDSLALANALGSLPAQTNIYAVVVRNPDLTAIGEQTRTAARALATHLSERLRG